MLANQRNWQLHACVRLVSSAHRRHVHRTQRQTCAGTSSWDACGHQQLGVGVTFGWVQGFGVGDRSAGVSRVAGVKSALGLGSETA